ncbi:hypothetical protein DFO66_102134 [Brevibacterium sanguinis]|uniref:Lipoprotein n=2 Tax=Brevibacterium TaxID=1696 RepID=A0A366ILK7_9MICO|nr:MULTISPECIES: hypothetical protein [Brevibacterium]RBP67081.1 hypothetical protein DFO66_102134 [Brevibacterium sanguinis]RBP73606.1 hypothetical protein DFO65_102134 [Brevibacterium celere]
MTSRSRTLTAVGAAAALGLVLSGCSALHIRTAERDSGPVRVAVQETAGEDPTPEPTDGGIPEGMSRSTFNLGAECPVTVSFAVGSDWTQASTTDSFHVLSRGDSIAQGDVIIVNCSQAFDDSPQAVVDSQKKYSFSEQGSMVQAEHSGTIDAGSYWTYQGVLGPTEIFAIDQKSTVMYGARIGYQTNGRLVDIGVEMRALETDVEAAEDFKAMLPTIEIDGNGLETPTFR